MKPKHKEQLKKQAMKRIFLAMQKEYEFQRQKYGSDKDEFNRPVYSIGDYLCIMKRELEEAMLVVCKPDSNAIEEILQVITVGMACLLNHGLVERNPIGFTVNRGNGHDYLMQVIERCNRKSSELLEKKK